MYEQRDFPETERTGSRRAGKYLGHTRLSLTAATHLFWYVRVARGARKNVKAEAV